MEVLATRSTKPGTGTNTLGAMRARNPTLSLQESRSQHPGTGQPLTKPLLPGFQLTALLLLPWALKAWDEAGISHSRLLSGLEASELCVCVWGGSCGAPAAPRLVDLVGLQGSCQHPLGPKAGERKPHVISRSCEYTRVDGTLMDSTLGSGWPPQETHEAAVNPAPCGHPPTRERDIDVR